MTDKVKAPWNEKQVQALMARQEDYPQHAYTCDKHSERALVPTINGWVCNHPGCQYTQDWAHESDTKPVKKSSASSLLETLDELCTVRFVSMIVRVHIKSGKRVKTYAKAGYYKVSVGIEDTVQRELLHKILEHPADCVVEPPYNPKQLGLDQSYEIISTIEFVTLENREVRPDEMSAVSVLAKYAKEPESAEEKT